MFSKLIRPKFRLALLNKYEAKTSRYTSSWKDFFSEKKDFGSYKIVKPGFVSEKLYVPSHITRPPYAKSDVEPTVREPEIKNAEQIKGMRYSCYLAKYILDEIGKLVSVGRSTDEIDKVAHRLCIDYNAYPSPLNYHNFPKSICTSVNNVACHGIPDDRLLEDGDIINIDVSVYLNGYHGDCSATFLVGNVDEKGCNLVKATEDCLKEAIAICRDGEYFSTIGAVVEDTARKHGLSVVPCFTGHGIGNYFHGPPDIYHCYNDYPGKMRAGMTFTIEPVLTQGNEDIVVLEDGWTAVTLDYARSAQFEHTLLITNEGVEILTTRGKALGSC